MAEGAGVELARLLRSTVFETAAVANRLDLPLFTCTAVVRGRWESRTPKAFTLDCFQDSYRRQSVGPSIVACRSLPGWADLQVRAGGQTRTDAVMFLRHVPLPLGYIGSLILLIRVGTDTRNRTEAKRFGISHATTTPYPHAYS